jgi:hypothetical protein
MVRNGLKTICVDLPDYIVSMLEDLSKLLNITPSQLLAKMLHPVYGIWRAAKEADVRGVATIAIGITSATSTSSTADVATGCAMDVNKVVRRF